MNCQEHFVINIFSKYFKGKIFANEIVLLLLLISGFCEKSILAKELLSRLLLYITKVL